MQQRVMGLEQPVNAMCCDRGAECQSFSYAVNEPQYLAKRQPVSFAKLLSVGIAQRFAKLLAIREPVDISKRKPVSFAQLLSVGIAQRFAQREPEFEPKYLAQREPERVADGLGLRRAENRVLLRSTQ